MKITNDDFQLVATTIRTLSMDAVQKANSGHPGMPMGCADIASVLWLKHLVHDPADTEWMNRDRFVLSAGHGSMLLYSLLHFSGYGLGIEDLMKFRQIGSMTPGHPEHRVTRGVETTTGPLGQGFANGIGMAVARDLLAEEFNSDGAEVIDHHIYVLCSDGDLMEGLSSESASLAGHLGLGRLIYIYDSNGISIEGRTDLAFSEDVRMRFQAYRWDVQEVDGHNYGQIDAALERAKKVDDRPSLIIARTSIAKGSASLEGNEESHGAPLGDKEVKASKIKIGCDGDACFCVPERVYQLFRSRGEENASRHAEWSELFAKTVAGTRREHWNRYFAAPDIAALRKTLPSYSEGESIATRIAGGKILDALFRELPNLVGGSADLGPSNKTFVKGFSETGKGKVGRNIHFGIREHAMGSIQNGIAYYGGFIPYSATFLAFMDYMRPSIRIAALGGLQTVYVFTHDSLFVGEDGPTHQPVEHISSARCIPDLCVIRPADAEETREAWLAALSRTNGPTLLSLTRQNLPVLKRTNCEAEELFRGAYVIHEPEGKPDIVILASGSEVSISVEAALALEGRSVKARVVSFPSWELFDRQPEEYRSKVLLHGTPKAVVEAGIRQGWERYAGNHALFITMETFGTSAPYKVLAQQFGFTAENVITRVLAHLGR